MEWEGFFSHGNSSSRGCAILFKRNLEVDEVELIYSSTDGRILMVGATIKQTTFKFINVYAPNITAQQIKFFASLQLLVEKHLLLQDRIKKQVVDKFMKIVDHLDLIDIFRIRNPEKKCYTWRQKKENIATRLDYWWISNILQDLVDDVDTIPYIRSDHSAIVLNMDSPHFSNSRGQGYWK